MLIPWEQFYSMVRPSVPGCPISLTDAAIKAAAQEFCRKTLIWTEEVICGDLVAGMRTYKFNGHDQPYSIVMPRTVIVREKQYKNNDPTQEVVSIRDHILKPTNIQDLELYTPQWRRLQAEYPTRYWMKDPNTFIFVEVPTKDKYEALKVFCAVQPSTTSDGVPEHIFDNWGEVIAAGALKRLLAMKGRVWADSSLVQYYHNIFYAGISQAKSKMHKSWVTQSKSVIPQLYI